MFLRERFAKSSKLEAAAESVTIAYQQEVVMFAFLVYVILSAAIRKSTHRTV